MSRYVTARQPLMLDRGLASTTYYSATSSFSRNRSIVPQSNPISRQSWQLRAPMGPIRLSDVNAKIVCATSLARDRFSAPGSTFVVAAPYVSTELSRRHRPTFLASVNWRWWWRWGPACERGTSMRVIRRAIINAISPARTDRLSRT